MKTVLEYYTQDASWNPSYDVRISSINKPLNITYKANVTQTTGEDWTKVKLSIASGNPTTGSTAPTIYPWDLNIIEPYLSKKNNRSVSEETKNEEVFLVAEEMPSFNKPSDNNAPSIPLTISENQTNFSFNIDIPYDIPSKQQPTITILQTPSINATYKYSTVPKLSEYAYLVASMTDWQNLNLINGNANLYFENNYVGSTYLDTKAFGDTLKLSMGKDESMSVRRTKTKSFTEKNRLAVVNSIKNCAA